MLDFKYLFESKIIKQHVSKSFMFKDDTFVFEFLTSSGTAAIDLKYRDEFTEISIVGRSREVQRTLRNAFLRKYELSQDEGERLIVTTISNSMEMVELAAFIVGLLNMIQREIASYLSLDVSSFENSNKKMSIFWWDNKANFGDSIGPILVAEMLNIVPVNARQRFRDESCLYSVGSITAMIDRDDVVLWGSGLLSPLTDGQIVSLRRRKNIEVLAVRGRYTQLELEAKLGWNVPCVFGDPALLLPRYFEPLESTPSSKIALVMHWEHAKYLSTRIDDGIEVVNVGSDSRNVISQIAKAEVCISTSLHGVIVAQAYGVPWVWLQVSDHKLHSSDFKFDDFFTTINRRSVSKKSVSINQISSADWFEVAAMASIPELLIDLDALEDSIRSYYQ